MKRTRCEVCKDVLFIGDTDPLDRYLAGLGGWDGDPLAVCLGSWRNLRCVAGGTTSGAAASTSNGAMARLRVHPTGATRRVGSSES